MMATEISDSYDRYSERHVTCADVMATKTVESLRSPGPTDNCNARLVGGFDDGIAVYHQGLSGVHRQRGCGDRLHGGDRRSTHDGNVESHVLIRLRHLDNPDSGSRQRARSSDHLVGPLHGFDGHDRTRFHRDGLADVETGDRIGHLIAELKVSVLFRIGRSRGQYTVTGEQWRQKSRRID